MSEYSHKAGWEEGDGEQVTRILGQLEAVPVTDFDVARLRRNVRHALASSRAKAPGFALRFAAVAATVVVGVVSLFAVLDGAPPRVGQAVAESSSLVSVGRTPTGAVVFQFSDSGRPHTITKTTSPRPDAAGEVNVTHGRTYVDANGQPRPGEVVFYRID